MMTGTEKTKGATPIAVNLREDTLADLDRWRNDLAKRLGRTPDSRSEAIRAILEGHCEDARSRGLREPPSNNIREREDGRKGN
jgi:hypothetical protein